MKTKYLISFLLMLICEVPAMGQQAGSDSVRVVPQQVPYNLDLKSSRLFWKAKKVNGEHNGYVLFQSGAINTAPSGKLLNGKFIFHMNSIVVVDQLMPRDNREIEGVVKAGNFFAVSLYPTATMQVRSISPTGKANQYKVTGELTIKGVTKPLVFLSVISRSGQALHAEANFKINRTNWGINYKSGSFFSNLKDELIEDDIEITLKMLFVIPDGC